jgi:hypothetical protein
MNKKNLMPKIIKQPLFNIKRVNKCKIINFELNTPLNICINNLFISCTTTENIINLQKQADDSENQKWIIEKYKNNSYYIKSQSTNKYLGSIDSRTTILIDNKNDNTLWFINNQLNNFYNIGILNYDSNYDLFKINYENTLKIDNLILNEPNRIISENNNYLNLDISENEIYYDIEKLELPKQFWIIEKINNTAFHSIKNLYNNKFLGSDNNYNVTFHDSINYMTYAQIISTKKNTYKIKFNVYPSILIIRGHIRNSFKTEQLYNFINKIYNLNPNLKIFIHTWNIFCNNLSWRKINPNYNIVTEELIKAYFKNLSFLIEDIIIDDDSNIKLIGDITGKICKASKKGWKNYWYGKFRIIQHIKNKNIHEDTIIINTRFDILNNSFNLPENKLLELVRKSGGIKFTKNMFLESSFYYGIDNFYVGNINTMYNLIYQFNHNLDEILNSNRFKIRGQEHLICYVNNELNR